MRLNSSFYLALVSSVFLMGIRFRLSFLPELIDIISTINGVVPAAMDAVSFQHVIPHNFSGRVLTNDETVLYQVRAAGDSPV